MNIINGTPVEVNLDSIPDYKPMHMKKRLNCINFIQLELNRWNGFIFEMLSIELGDFDRSLFGVWYGGNIFSKKAKLVCGTFLYVDILFRRFRIIDA
jgi:hypothetical protein